MAGRSFVGVRKVYLASLAAAFDNRTGVGATLLVTAAQNRWPGSAAAPSAPRIAGQVMIEWHGGVQIDSIRIQPLANITKPTLVRFFIAAPTTKFMIHEQTIIPGTKPAARLPYDNNSLSPPYTDAVPPPYGPIDLNASQMGCPWPLNPTYSLYVSCATADPFVIAAFGGEYKPDDTD